LSFKSGNENKTEEKKSASTEFDKLFEKYKYSKKLKAFFFKNYFIIIHLFRADAANKDQLVIFYF